MRSRLLRNSTQFSFVINIFCTQVRGQRKDGKSSWKHFLEYNSVSTLIKAYKKGVIILFSLYLDCPIRKLCKDPVECYADPCQVSAVKPPCPKGTKCTPCYCGGCFYRCEKPASLPRRDDVRPLRRGWWKAAKTRIRNIKTVEKKSCRLA